MHRSFLKWAGGKANALPHVFASVPTSGGTLVEPFMGSCTVALNTEFDHFVLNDFNPDLVFLCAWVAKNPREVIQEARPLFVHTNNNKSVYYQMRARYNQSSDPKERALLFLYLNRHCYNGMMRYSQRKGEMNTPAGAYKKVSLPEDSMLFFSKKLKNARFVCGGFESLRFKKDQDTVVYCDPPYLPASPTASFAQYNKEGFSKAQHQLLDKKARLWAASSRGVWVSNHAVPLLDTCYPSAQQREEFMVSRTISCKGGQRIPIKEVLMAY